MSRRLTLAGSVTGAAVVALDGTVLTVVQPAMQRELHASFAQIQWTSTGYLIAVASLLVFAGRLGDRYGHRRVFAVGSLGFALTSAGIGLAPGIGWVIGLRVAQGVFGALLQPATLGMLRAVYPPDRLGMPIALRTSAIGVAAAAGPVVGGALADQLGWRSVFFLSVAPAFVIGVLALAVRVPEAPGDARQPLDLPGACLFAVTLGCLVHTLVGLPETGWTAVAAAAAGWAFVRHQRRAASPLLPPDVVGSAAVASALGVLVAASAALFGALFVATYFLQDALALDPLETGLRMLPLAVTMVLGAPVSAVLQRRYGPRRTAVAGMVLLALGVALFSRLDRAATAVAIGGCSLLMGAGFAAVMVTATAVIVRHAPAGSAGVAGGLQQTAMNVGPVVGVAAAAMLIAHGAVALMVLAAVAAAGALSALGLRAGPAPGTAPCPPSTRQPVH
ncbi:MFS transporter [Streptomyces sp. NPDC000410]|uniref:MFS transporter n=1 Tax=Streptomyces sp. NPDC000410 TaxID=3154254 RepID=UPI0033265711